MAQNVHGGQNRWYIRLIFRGKYAIIQERKMITVDENRNSNISSEHSEELLNIIENFRLMDDTFMSKVFEDKACAELLLRVILNRDDLTVVKVVSQFELKNLQGRSARLDIYAVDEHGKQYDVEVQRSDDGAAPRRARYNSSLLDANLLNPGDKFDELPESYIIFITEHDVLKGGKPLYTVNRTISELDHAIFTDGSHIIYERRDSQRHGSGRAYAGFLLQRPARNALQGTVRPGRLFQERQGGC